MTLKTEGNIKDLINNSAIHIDSLVSLQAKNKHKNIQNIVYMKKLNEALLPYEDYYSEFLGKIDGDCETVEVMDLEKFLMKGTEARPIEI